MYKHYALLSIIILSDIASSIALPIYLRRFSILTSKLNFCSEESGYKLFSNKCNGGEEYTMSVFASISYGLSVAISFALLLPHDDVIIKDINNDFINNFIEKIMNPSRTILLFALRNICLFNMVNFVSVREFNDELIGDEINKQSIRVSAVKMIPGSFLPMVGSTLLIALLISSIFPSKLFASKLGIKVKYSKEILWLLNILVWFVIISSVIYYIGATNVLGRNVLTMYDTRGPELLTVNFWNYGILLMIYLEYVIISDHRRVIAKFKMREDASMDLMNMSKVVNNNDK
jgi:hypothetical protein